MRKMMKWANVERKKSKRDRRIREEFFFGRGMLE
jgi:hypothetical protein